VRGIKGKAFEVETFPNNTYNQLADYLQSAKGVLIPQVTVGKNNFRLDKDGSKTLQEMGISNQTLVITTSRFDGGNH
jgi:hypothetical protein